MLARKQRQPIHQSPWSQAIPAQRELMNNFSPRGELRKINLFMQNKPKSQKSQMNVNKVFTKDYKKKTLGEHRKNKPKTNPNKANFRPDSTPAPRPTQRSCDFGGNLVWFMVYGGLGVSANYFCLGEC